MNTTTMAPAPTQVATRPQAREDASRVYQNDHVTAEMFREHMHFPPGTLAPGERLGSYRLFRPDGSTMSSHDLLNGKPTLMIMGSVSCPMTAASMPAVKKLHSRYELGVNFVMVNVREAHPGENVPQPKQLAEKLQHTRTLQTQLLIPFPVVSDDLDGSLHRALGALPNAAFLLDRDRTVLFRALWVGDEASVRRALEAIIRGHSPPEAESQRKVIPLAQGLGEMREMLERSGERAVADVWKAAPPLAVIAWTAGLFRPLPPTGRTVAALAALVGLPLALVGFALMARSTGLQGDGR